MLGRMNIDNEKSTKRDGQRERYWQGPPPPGGRAGGGRQGGGRQEERRSRLFVFAAIAVVAAAVGIAIALVLLKAPSTSADAGSAAAGVTPSYAQQSPSSGTQGGSSGGNGAGLPALPPLSGGGGGLQLMLNGRVAAVSGSSITLAGNGPDVKAAITSSTRFTGTVTSSKGVKVGDQISAQVSGSSASSLVAVDIQDPA